MRLATSCMTGKLWVALPWDATSANATLNTRPSIERKKSRIRQFEACNLAKSCQSIPMNSIKLGMEISAAICALWGLLTLTANVHSKDSELKGCAISGFVLAFVLGFVSLMVK